MKKLLNTLYVVNEEAYLTLDGENIVVNVNGKILGRVPLHTLEAIICFSYKGASPALMGACLQRLLMGGSKEMCCSEKNNIVFQMI